MSPYEVTPEEPRLRLRLAMFGNRITDLDINKDYLYTMIKEGKLVTDFSNLDKELGKKQTFNTTKGKSYFPNIVPLGESLVWRGIVG